MRRGRPTQERFRRKCEELMTRVDGRSVDPHDRKDRQILTKPYCISAMAHNVAADRGTSRFTAAICVSKFCAGWHHSAQIGEMSCSKPTAPSPLLLLF